MAIRSFRFLLAALPALTVACAQGGQTYDDGSDGVNSHTDGEDDDVANDDVGDDDVANDDVGDDDVADDDDVSDDDVTDDDSSSTCEDIQDEVVVARDAAVSEVDTTCQQDEDCEPLGSQPRCLATCGGFLAIGSSDGSLLDAAIGEIEDSLCQDFDNAGCQVLAPGCPVSTVDTEYQPRCVENECAYVEVDTADQCADLARQAEVLHGELVAEADVSCETVDDCAVVPNTLECATGCPPAIGVNVTDEERVRAEMADGVENICTPFSNLPCTVSAIDCTTDAYQAACLDGRCVAQLPTEVGTADQCADLVRQAEVLHGELVAGADTTCETVDDCAVVLHSPPCAVICSLPIAVNVGNEDRVRSEMTSGDEAVCTPFDELACPPVPFECESNEHQPACLDGRCVAQLPTGDCYGPDQNLDLAYSGTISGCPCSDEGSVCILPVALICSGGAWQAVEDGPCSPGVSESPCDGRVDSPMDCVDLFETCFELSTGTFCGVGHTTDLCPDGMIVQSSADCLQDDATCVELENGLYCTG